MFLVPAGSLAGSLRVNPATVVQAYRDLASDGFVEMRHGQGTFVAAGAKADQVDARRQWLVDELRQIGRQSMALGLSTDELHGLLGQALDQLTNAVPTHTSAESGEEQPT